jgi:hypothetical protein
MKQIYLVLFLICALLASCENDSKNETAKNKKNTISYKSTNLNFSMEHPKNFEAIEAINSNIPVGFFIQEKDSAQGYRENLLLSIEELPIIVPFDDYVQAGKTQLKIMMPQVEITDESNTNVDGHKIATYKYSFTKDSIAFVSKFYVIPLEKRAYQFNSTCPKTSMAQYEPIFDAMINSLKFQ